MITLKKTAILCIFALISFSVFANHQTANNSVNPASGFQHWVSYGNKDAMLGGIFNFVMNQSGAAYLGGFAKGGQSISMKTLNKKTNTWDPIGNSISSLSPFSSISSAIDSTHKKATPYISYAVCNDDTGAGSLFVDHLINGQWIHVGNGPIATNTDCASSISPPLAVSNRGLSIINQNRTSVPYALYGNSNWGYTVVRFNGKNWVQVGNSLHGAGFYPESSELAIGQNGVPFLALEDFDNPGGITVMTLLGNAWQPVGADIQNIDDNDGLTVAINPITDTPYVAYVHENLDNLQEYVKVVKFNQETDQWDMVGNKLTEPQYDESPTTPALTFSSTGQPYIAFQSTYTPPEKKYFFVENNVLRLNLENQWTLVGNENAVKNQGVLSVNLLVLNSQNAPFFSHITNDGYGTVETLG